MYLYDISIFHKSYFFRTFDIGETGKVGEKQLRQILASKAVSETEVKDMLAGEE